VAATSAGMAVEARESLLARGWPLPCRDLAAGDGRLLGSWVEVPADGTL